MNKTDIEKQISNKLNQIKKLEEEVIILKGKLCEECYWCSKHKNLME